jgi:hypothetical protein
MWMTLLLMVMTVDMVSSRATFRLGRTRVTSGLRQCGRIELMSSMVDTDRSKNQGLHPP